MESKIYNVSRIPSSIFKVLSGKDVMKILEYQCCYQSLDDPKSYMQHELYKLTLIAEETEEEIKTATIIVNEIAKSLSESFTKFGEAIREVIREVFSQISQVDSTISERASKFIANTEIDSYKYKIDRRELIRRNVRNHRY